MALNVCVDVAYVFVPSARPAHTHALGPVSPHVMLAVHTGLTAFIALEFISVLFYWLGRSWARWFVLVGCLYNLISLKDLASFWGRSRIMVAVTALDAVLALFLLWYLHKRSVRLWFHERSINRPTNK